MCYQGNYKVMNVLRYAEIDSSSHSSSSSRSCFSVTADDLAAAMRIAKKK
jgi:hypothetical protein